MRDPEHAVKRGAANLPGTAGLTGLDPLLLATPPPQLFETSNSSADSRSPRLASHSWRISRKSSQESASSIGLTSKPPGRSCKSQLLDELRWASATSGLLPGCLGAAAPPANTIKIAITGRTYRKWWLNAICELTTASRETAGNNSVNTSARASSTRTIHFCRRRRVNARRTREKASRTCNPDEVLAANP